MVSYSEPDVSQGFSPASFIVLFVCLSVCLMSQKGVYESTGLPGGLVYSKLLYGSVHADSRALLNITHHNGLKP